MRKLILYILVSAVMIPETRADEGMWLLPLINQLNIKDMKKAGFKLSAENIYSINHSSIKDAVVIFGGGCTGEIISSQGLLLTNHHCGYGAIQQHSSVEHDYLKDGFWAKTMDDEIPTPGLLVRFLERIEDVTDQIIPYIENIADETERANKISEISDSLSKLAKNNATWLDAYVSSMFGGNNYYLVVYKIYNDVRMVGAPPSSIGKFGDDTDNWMWPRHTGDFSLFRVYTDAAGNPAKYSKDNIPLKPKYHLPVSLKGFSEGDFAMVLGFPGSTQRYMTSWEVDERINIGNTNLIKIRGIRQGLMMEDMLADPKVKIQYATKYAGSSNYWKNAIGMNKALKRLKVIDRKREQEAEFNRWTGEDARKKTLYSSALPLIDSAVSTRAADLSARQYLVESLARGSEIISFATAFTSLKEFLQKNDTAAFNRRLPALKASAATFFKNYNQPTDKKITAAMLKLYSDDVPENKQAEIVSKIRSEYNGDFGKYTEYLFSTTILADSVKLSKFLDNPVAETIANDPAVEIAESVLAKLSEFHKNEAAADLKYREGHRRYVAGLKEMYAGKRPVYPDANFTMRMTYGVISGYSPANAEHFDYITTLDGVMEKEDLDNWEFEVPDKLKQLYLTQDFGDYKLKDGRLPVNFIFNGDITGGNSGSPVLNSKGQLIGTAFDGNWEAMSGDIAFEPQLQRCINQDIRYTLFIIDKFAGAKRLIDEMTIIK